MRTLNQIAKDIAKDWANINYAAKPYLSAMAQLNSIDDKYYHDNARSIVLYFLANANSWRGENARNIKKELKALCSIK